MQVRMKIGPRAGEIVELVYDRAKALVEAGQAEDVHDQMRLPKAKIERVDAVSVEGQQLPMSSISVESPTKKKGRRIG